MLSRIEARDFRCFEHVQAELHPETTVLRGRNAQGKTSLLEAACVLLRLQSPRTSTRTDLIRHGQASFMVEGVHGADTLRCGMSARQRRLAVNGAVMGRSGEYLKESGVVVWMDHGDMNLLRGGAEHRRRYLDFTASQTERGYLDALRTYERALRSRNYVLKRDAQINWRHADAYAQIMDKAAEVIWQARNELVDATLEPARRALEALSMGKEELGVRLVRGAEAGGLFEQLVDQREQEQRTRTTAVGPHRDDLWIGLHERDAGSFASEGQQRSLSVALKLAQARVLENRRGEAPLLLMDDVFGELDATRRQLLMENLPQGSQRVVTTTGGDWVEQQKDAIIYDVDAGSLKLVK
ncbi:MAG: DNA replication/repair protein RecF [Verrucomicrobiaceae bacterium]|nr:DNA replication/repair protein RecF [Verrucomicrobiaceae bacterium]